ncbi:MAG: AraC family transcriptional regulator [Pseudomonadota bacterium]
MESERFRIDRYITPDEAFHFARKNLARRFPRRAHYHDFYEVFLILDGRTSHWINGETQILERGQLAFIRPWDVHAFRADRQRGCEIINVMFRNESATHLVSRYADSLAGRFFDAKSALPELHTLGPNRFERAVNVAMQLQTAPRTLACIEEFLLVLTNRVAVPQRAAVAVGPPWFSAACNAALSQDVFRKGASEFVRIAGRSHEHVCRTCQEVLGLTPTEFINRIRIEHAARLLRSEDTPIELIAERCGFENTSYFYRLFGAAFNTTPRRYRAEHRRDPFAASAAPG